MAMSTMESIRTTYRRSTSPYAGTGTYTDVTAQEGIYRTMQRPVQNTIPKSVSFPIQDTRDSIFYPYEKPVTHPPRPPIPARESSDITEAGQMRKSARAAIQEQLYVLNQKRKNKEVSRRGYREKRESLHKELKKL